MKIENDTIVKRKKTRSVQVGTVKMGGDAPISVQSMTKTKTADVAATVSQILELEAAGCEIIRSAVPDMAAADALAEIKKQIHIPLVADIHFDYQLALKSLEAGVDKIRLNPGNIGSSERIRKVLTAAKVRQIPIRIGVNAGSLEKDLIQKYGHPCAEALVESVLRHVSIAQDFGFDDLVLSLKASNVPLMLESYRLISEQVDFPLHLGVTEAGTRETATIKSAVGIGTLLAEGIGDTIRVSITDDPVNEVQVGFQILKSLDMRDFGINFVSCPTCGRTEIDLFEIANQVEKRLKHVNKKLTVAIMGCVVNGPGEAADADIGIACGKNSALLFKKGKTVRKLEGNEIVDVLVAEVQNW